MADGRRHSVDIPISKTLVALRRVRSLRDPSTNSMTKFSGLIDDVNWDTNSKNEISIHFLNRSREEVADNYGVSKSKNSCLSRDKKNFFDEITKTKLIMCEKLGRKGILSSPIRTKGADILACDGHESIKENYFSSSNALEEDVNSLNELIMRSSQAEKMDRTRKSRCKNQLQPSCSAGCETTSQVSSLFQSIVSGVSKLSSSPYLTEEVDVVDQNHHGCGIGCCWSKTPKFKDSNLYSEVEGYPLLRGSVDETALYGQSQWGSKHVNKETLSSSGTPTNLCQKFRPTSFDDLVGQNAVSKSLQGAVLLGRISTFYLFYGPRGTGKTSASRIFAAALNCLSLEERRPCGLCRECVSFFSGRSRDIQEVESLRINKTDRIRSLVKDAVSPSVSSRFKVFIIDECHMLRGETWATLLSSFDNFSRHSVFIMITPDLDRLPRSVVSQSQKFHFPKIREADIASRLGKICLEERLDFDPETLDFISSKSNGSIRDAEMMLEQLSLLGKKITSSMAHELIGIVSDEELLDLLDLALSSDTSNTVIKARELMRSRIEPMQLMSQLANLIMDILAGKHEETSSEVRRKFITIHSAEADVQKLSHALKILSEAEKQLRISKNQTTWLTVALLQLSSVESFSSNAHEAKLGLRNINDKDGDFCSRSSGGESLKHLVPSCDDIKFGGVGVTDECKETLDSIWKRAAELSQSNSVKKFLTKRGKLSALSLNHGLAIAELEFSRPSHVSRAEKSWKQIASSLQAVLGQNVEIRINLSERNSDLKHSKTWRLPFSFFGCSLRNRQKKTRLITECCGDSGFKDCDTEKLSTTETRFLTGSSCCGPLNCTQKMEVFQNLRNSDGNVLSTMTITSQDNGLKMPGNRCRCGCGLLTDEATSIPGKTSFETTCTKSSQG